VSHALSSASKIWTRPPENGIPKDTTGAPVPDLPFVEHNRRDAVRHSMRCVSFGIEISNASSALRAPNASSALRALVCDLGLSLNTSVFETRFETDEGGHECDRGRTRGGEALDVDAIDCAPGGAPPSGSN
jgi:hypothetical protein